jgi:hypothetical protein
MRVTKLLLTSGCQGRKSLACSPVGGNTYGSPYRVLRPSPRGAGRSVDRECAGRNATSVKGSSPEKHPVLWWPSHYEEAKAASNTRRVPRRTAVRGALRPSRLRRVKDTTGVHDHGMYTRPAAERERSARSRTTAARPRSRASEQGVTTEFKAILRAEVRCSRSSEEVG